MPRQPSHYNYLTQQKEHAKQVAFFSKALSSIKKRTPSLVDDLFEETQEFFQHPKETLADLLGERDLYEGQSALPATTPQHLRAQTLARIRRQRRELARRRGTLSTIFAGSYGLLHPTATTPQTNPLSTNQPSTPFGG